MVLSAELLSPSQLALMSLLVSTPPPPSISAIPIAYRLHEESAPRLHVMQCPLGSTWPFQYLRALAKKKWKWKWKGASEGCNSSWIGTTDEECQAGRQSRGNHEIKRP